MDLTPYYPEFIYALHRVAGGWQPTVFDKRTRTFRWGAVKTLSPTGVPDSWESTEFQEEVQQFLEVIRRLGEDPKLKGCLEWIEKWIKSPGNPETWRPLLLLYAAYPQDPKLGLHGIVYRNLGPDNPIALVQGKLLWTDKGSYHKYPWIKAQFFDYDGKGLPGLCRYHCQEAWLQRNRKSLEKPSEEPQPPPGFLFAQSLLDVFFLQGTSQDQSQDQAFVLLPVYDAWVGDRPWGSLWGVLLRLGQPSSESVAELHRRVAYPVAMELERSAIADIMAQPLEGAADVVQHFVRHIVRLQDWERVVVYRDDTPQYCYRRRREGLITSWEWCSKDCGHPEVSNPPGLRWEKDFWTPEILGLTSDEAEALGEYRIEFEYPATAVLPNDAQELERVHQFYLRQQMAVMRELLVKFRARRHARQAAAASILSRNLAHNIHSHVTPRATVEAVRQRLGARYSGSQALEVVEILKGRLDQYLAERADFIAEVTSEPLTTTKPVWFYKEVVLPLITNTLWTDNIAKNEGVDCQKLQIRVWIKETEMRVGFRCCDSQCDCPEYVYPPDGSGGSLPFSTLCEKCPNCSCPCSQGGAGPVLRPLIKGEDVEVEVPGSVGEHALYGFLENLIRNAAKHNKDKLKCGILSIYLCLEPEDEEFYRLEVWDNLSGAEKVDSIKAHIQEDLVDEELHLRREAWGIAEMKIAATLLAGCRDFGRLREFLGVDSSPRCRSHGVTNQLVYKLRLMRPKLVVVLKEGVQ